MKYATYYEDNQVITYGQYEELMEEITQKEHAKVLRDVVMRKVIFRSLIAEETLEEKQEYVRYSICMKDFKTSELYVERKTMQRGLIYKSYVKISKKDCQKILSGDISWMKHCNKSLLQDFYLELTINGLQPVIMRETVKDVCENVDGKDGIVFYKSIKAAKDCYTEFFEKELPMMDCMNCDTMIRSFKKNIKIPIAVSGIIHMWNGKGSTLAYCL